MGIMDRMMETQLGKMTPKDKIAMMTRMHSYMFSKLSPNTRVEVFRNLIKGLKGGK
jgi:hypothetical protein